jgi:hypothetical protein
MGHFPFFRADAGEDLIADTIRLGLVFKTSPLAFADLTQSALDEIMRVTADVLEQMRRD